jgi:hypothetical protein
MDREQVGAAVAGGVVGTGVISGILVMLEVQMRDVLHLFDAVARFVGLPGQTFLGFVIYSLAGAVVWPLIFLALRPYLPRGPDPAAQGAVFATALWVVFAFTGRGDLSGGLLVVYLVFTLLAHWAYGFTMGAVYGYLTGETPRARGEPAPR